MVKVRISSQSPAKRARNTRGAPFQMAAIPAIDQMAHALARRRKGGGVARITPILSARVEGLIRSPAYASRG